MADEHEQERLRRWRLILGREAEGDPQGEQSGGESGEGLQVALTGDDAEMDRVLAALYESDRQRGLGSSSPHVNRWLGDIRKYFPGPMVQVMQKDALERLHLTQMLLQPETLAAMEPDVHLVATLLSLKNVMPARTRETARQVVRTVVDRLRDRLRQPMLEAVRGALHRSSRTRRPRPHEIDWHRTIQRNLKHYLAKQQTIVLQQLVGYGRRRSSLRDVVLCVDQSGSMAASVVYASLFAAVLASIPSVRTSLVVFDTEVADLTEALADPVQVLFGAQLGGGTDINRAVGYCQSLFARPSQTIFVLITDLFEGGDEEELLQRMARIQASGVTAICLLALSDQGRPVSDERLAAAFASLGIPAFGCTPDLFPELMSAAIGRHDIQQWAARNALHTTWHSPIP